MSLDKYRRVEKPKTGIEIQENEIRITATGQPRGYIAYATTLFEVQYHNILHFRFQILNSLLKGKRG
jgi:hypothetical protein